MVNLTAIRSASDSIRGYIHRTPLLYSSSLSKISGAEVFLKLENLQKTGSFKVRGAFNKILKTKQEDLVAASMGNHAQAVAFAASGAGKRALIIMPVTAPIVKQEATRQYGGEVVLYGEAFHEALNHALKQKDRVFIHAFDDQDVIAGQGTSGLEIVDDLMEFDAVLVPVGGGGLISGVATAIKGMLPDVKVYGVQVEAAPAVFESFKYRKLIERLPSPTIADGIAIERLGTYTYEIIMSKVDDLFLVSEDEIAMAVLLFMERKKLVVEGAGAVPLAALLKHRERFIGKRVVLLLSGGNIDFTLIDRIIRKGLTRSGRIGLLSVTIDDRPGSLRTLLSHIETSRTNILDIAYDRNSGVLPIGQTKVNLLLELREREHGEEIKDVLEGKGYDVILSGNE